MSNGKCKNQRYLEAGDIAAAEVFAKLLHLCVQRDDCVQCDYRVQRDDGVQRDDHVHPDDCVQCDLRGIGGDVNDDEDDDTNNY